MKQIDIIRAEIKSRIAKRVESVRAEGNHTRTVDGSVTVELMSLLSFIDTLQEPEVDDAYIERSLKKVHLEKELAAYIQHWDDDEEFGLVMSTEQGIFQIQLEDIRDIARHFYELGRVENREKSRNCKP